MSIIKIRTASPDDLNAILLLFRQTIETINSKDYSCDQIEVWKNGVSAKEKWLMKISQQFFLVAEIENTLVGFGSITPNGYLDFMYVSKDHQRIGIAQKLFDGLQKFAASNQVDKIISDVSITAKPFFEKQGFQTVKEQQVMIDGVQLTNYKMEKRSPLL
jgi:putative acetyltransferase